MVKFDCFACKVKNNTTICDALKVQDCEKCRFYKTKEQLKAERVKYPFHESPDGVIPKGAIL